MLLSILQYKFKKYFFFLLLCSLTSLSSAQHTEEVIVPGMYQMPETTDTQNNEPSPRIKAGVREDLHKFMGYEIVLARYLSIPYDVFVNTNLDVFFTDVGFLLLLLLPILFLFPQRILRQQSISQRIGLKLTIMALCMLLLLVSIPNAYLNKHNLTTPQEGLQLLASSSQVGWIESTSETIHQFALYIYTPIHQVLTIVSGQRDAVTYPLLVMIFGVLLVLIVLRIQRHPKRTKGMILFLLVYFLLWWILGVGAAWYGLLLFCIPYVFLVKAMSFQNGKRPFVWSTENISPAFLKSSLLMSICFIWLLMAFTFRTTNYNPINKERAKHIYIPPIMEYQTGKINETKLLGFHFPQHHEIQKIINREDESLVYRVGTSINYFIRKNDKRVMNDTFLDNFAQLVTRFKTKQKIIQALKVAGFKYIVIDLNMASNDYTPEKTLTKKFIQLLNTLHDNPEVELLSTNRTLQLHSNGHIVNEVFEDKGAIVNGGDVALFGIK